MAGQKVDLRFVVLFGVVWICFGVFGLIEAPERRLVTISQFAAGIIHFVYAFLVWRRANSK
jgi:uncharacterized membrane protein HdeD (DUF308 family)